MMPAMEATAMKVLDGTAVRSPTQLQDAYELFRLERQGNLVTPRTLEFYDLRIGEFFAWLGRDAPGVERIADVDVNHLRRFRAHLAAGPRADGKLLQPETLHASHRTVLSILGGPDSPAVQRRAREEPTEGLQARYHDILVPGPRVGHSNVGKPK